MHWRVFRPFIPLLVAILLLAASAVLAVLQASWIAAASKADEERMRRSLELDARRVRQDAEEEVGVLLSLVRVSGSDFTAKSWSQIVEGVRLWQENARYPKLLGGAWIVSVPLSANALTYSEKDGGFVSEPLSAEMRAQISALLESGEQASSLAATPPEAGIQLIVQPIFSPVGPGIAPDSARKGRTVGAVVIQLDTRVLYGELIPLLVQSHLGAMPYRLVSVASGKEIGSSPGVHANQQPEVEIGLEYPGTGEPRPGIGPERPNLSGIAREGSLADSPMVRLWELRSRGELAPATGAPGSSAGAPPASATPNDAQVILQVFYPNSSIASLMRRRIAANLAVSFGILVALLASVVVFYRLYRTSARLRASEQEFVASMSHELRTPISVLQAASENLSRGVVSDRSRLPRYARVINDQVKRLSGMVESILFYAGLQSGMGKEPVRSEVDLAALVREVSNPLQQLATEHGRALRVALEGLPPAICCDPMALRLIIENLVMNAIRHVDGGEIRLSVSRRPFDILRITVEDDGQGIPAREQGGIFGAFVRGSRSMREQRPGSGLGLHLVKRVAATLGGEVALESPYLNIAETMQPGCRFTVTLPCKERCADA